MKKLIKILSKPLILLVSCLIRIYQLAISPFLFANCCRFTPSCSQYCLQAISAHGLIKGGYLMCKRLLKCQPFSKKSGFDPVEKPEL
jgi:putative membrane protein insertion efficiency factor